MVSLYLLPANNVVYNTEVSVFSTVQFRLESICRTNSDALYTLMKLIKLFTKASFKPCSIKEVFLSNYYGMQWNVFGYPAENS